MNKYSHVLNKSVPYSNIIALWCDTVSKTCRINETQMKKLIDFLLQRAVQYNNLYRYISMSKYVI